MNEMLGAEIWTIAQTGQGNVVLLRPKDLDVTIPVFIGAPELQAILIGKEGVSLSRPMTHDLFLNLLRLTGLSLRQAEIYDIKNDVFYARIVLAAKDAPARSPLILECRPSDAIALAVRKRRPLFVASKLIDLIGIPLEHFIENTEAAAETPEDKYRNLLKQLNRAVAAEEYEKAAELRDMLILLEHERDSLS